VVAITVRVGWRRPVVAIRIWRRERWVGMMMVGMRALAAVPAVVITSPIGPAAAAAPVPVIAPTDPVAATAAALLLPRRRLEAALGWLAAPHQPTPAIYQSRRRV
jgi:hypothetical protein